MGQESKKKCRKSEETFSRQKTMLRKLVDSDHHMGLVLCLCGVFLLYGMSDEILGPTLIELSCLVAKPLKTMSWLFFAHDSGLLCGTVLGSFIVGRVDTTLAVASCLLGNALCIAILPSLHQFSATVIIVFLYGVCLGSPDTLSNVLLVKVFGSEVSPYLQGVHFFYGFGSFLIPLLARPFLRKSCTYTIQRTTYFPTHEMAKNLTYDNYTGYWISNSIEDKVDNSSNVMFVYWITATLHFAVIFSLCWLYLKKCFEKQHGMYKGSYISLNDPNCYKEYSLDLVPYTPESTFWERLYKDTNRRRIGITMISSFLLYIYQGLMAMFGGYVYFFAVKGVVAMTADQGAYLTSTYWGFFSVGRLFSIILAFVLSPKVMLTGNVVGCLFSALVFAVGHTNIKAVYVGTSLLGLSLSSTSPTIIALARCYVNLTARGTSMFIISAALGELTMPIIVGQLSENLSLDVVPMVVFLLCCTGFLGYCLLLTFANEKALEQVHVLWRILHKIWCLSCDSPSPQRYGSYTTRTSSPDPKEEIPKPDVTTGCVQPKGDWIEDDEILGDIEFIVDENMNDKIYVYDN